MEDREYRNRFTSCLMQFYGKNMELHIFEELEQIQNQDLEFADCVILEGQKGQITDFLQNFSKEAAVWKQKVLYLQEDEDFSEELQRDLLEQNALAEVVIVDKYKNINEIVEYVRRIHPTEIKIASENIPGKNQARLLGIYSLSDSGRQLPFAITLGNVLAEKEKVLLLDLQENSGIREYCGNTWDMGLEELAVMAGGKESSFGNLSSCIGHIERMDYVYPARNCESLCEIDAEVYQRLLEVLLTRVSYDVVILNFGTRFQGFCQIFSSCSKVYFLEGKTLMSQWRKKEFLEELEQKGYGEKHHRIQSVELPLELCSTGFTCQKLVEQWRWSSFGDLIRSLCQKAVCYG